jgi:magnesium transporter
MISVSLEHEFLSLIEDKEWWKLKSLLREVPAVDIAEWLEDLNADEALVVFRLLVNEKAADVFSYLSNTKGTELLDIFSKRQLSDVMTNLEPDEQVAFLEELPGRLTFKVLASLDPERKKEVQRLLGYPEESIGRIMTTKFIRIRSEWTVKKSLKHLRIFGKLVESLNVIYVVDEEGRLIDDLRLTDLVLADPDQKIADIMDSQFVAVTAFEDREEAVKMLSKYDLVALPVVDSRGILIGKVTVDDIIDVAEEEATEDMLLMGGMDALDDRYSRTDIPEMVKKRVGWLIILFLGQMLTVTALATFESALAAAAVLAFFIPMIISSGGNSGSQAATLIIRSLSIGDLDLSDWKKVLGRELLSGLLLGSIVGIMGTAVIGAWLYMRGEPADLNMLMQALTVGTSLVGVIIFGNLAGAMLPFLMTKIKLDPAVTSAPFVATLVDVTGILIYFSMATLLLRNLIQ